MPVVCVLAQANIRHYHHFGEFFLDSADGLLNDAISGKVFQPHRILLCWNTKQDYRRNIQFCGLLSFPNSFIYGELRNARHGYDRCSSFSVTNEQRINEITGIQFGLTYHRAQRFGLATNDR